MINNNTKVKIGETEYEVKYPNVKQKIEIETMKMFLSGNEYGKLVRSGHKTGLQLLDLIDAVSYFSVLIPEFGKGMTVGVFEDMDLQAQFNVVKAYKTEFYPWYNQLEESINKVDEKTENDTDKGDSPE